MSSLEQKFISTVKNPQPYNETNVKGISEVCVNNAIDLQLFLSSRKGISTNTQDIINACVNLVERDRLDVGEEIKIVLNTNAEEKINYISTEIPNTTLYFSAKLQQKYNFAKLEVLLEACVLYVHNNLLGTRTIDSPKPSFKKSSIFD